MQYSQNLLQLSVQIIMKGSLQNPQRPAANCHLLHNLSSQQRDHDLPTTPLRESNDQQPLSLRHRSSVASL